jgi:hypothetical protein
MPRKVPRRIQIPSTRTTSRGLKRGARRLSAREVVFKGSILVIVVLCPDYADAIRPLST